jgi:hypothetical protein
MLNVNQMLHIPFSPHYCTHFPAESKILQTKKKKNHTGDRREKNKGEYSKVYTETNFRDVANIGMSLYKCV